MNRRPPKLLTVPPRDRNSDLVSVPMPLYGLTLWTKSRPKCTKSMFLPTSESLSVDPLTLVNIELYITIKVLVVVDVVCTKLQTPLNEPSRDSTKSGNPLRLLTTVTRSCCPPLKACNPPTVLVLFCFTSVLLGLIRTKLSRIVIGPNFPSISGTVSASILPLVRVTLCLTLVSDL